MIVKKKFDLIAEVDNVLNMSAFQLNKAVVENGPRRVSYNIQMMSNKISHYTKNRVLNTLTILDKRKYLQVLNLPNYPLPVSYNVPTKSIIINVSPFGITDIESNKPGPYNLYAMMVYGIVFSELVSGKMKIDDKYSSVISNFFDSVLIRLFGKQYGLLGSFSTQIPKLKFFTNLYILTSFFGIEGLTAYKKASAASAYSYKEISDRLPKYDFSNINNFINALSDFGIMPNLNRHTFGAKVLRFFGINVMPAFEDCSRFIATLATSDIKGSNVISTYISKYNERDFAKILEISKVIFKRI